MTRHWKVNPSQSHIRIVIDMCAQKHTDDAAYEISIVNVESKFEQKKWFLFQFYLFIYFYSLFDL